MVFFGGLLLTGFGSAYYHWEPGNARLAWDRLPLAITLMGLLAATIAERIGVKSGLWLLGPLVALAAGSVIYWHWTEQRGAGDLRLYALVQFYPLVAIPLMLWWLAPRYTRGARSPGGRGDLRGGQGAGAPGRVDSLGDPRGERAHAQTSAGRAGRVLGAAHARAPPGGLRAGTRRWRAR